ncbi:uncharacterized protein [Diabrotica undecimpunctata]|uniref:uncharacterized protein n=1 Tax=Diabrotica undecimpunctata TaxID=50387 RepID=UPI003B641888
MLLLKNDNDPEPVKSYRPNALLNTPSKLLKSLIREGLQKELRNKKIISDKRYGFRKRRSTVHAVNGVKLIVDKRHEKWFVVASVDIKKAFSIADWRVIFNKLETKGLQSYHQRKDWFP